MVHSNGLSPSSMLSVGSHAGPMRPGKARPRCAGFEMSLLSSLSDQSHWQNGTEAFPAI